MFSHASCKSHLNVCICLFLTRLVTLLSGRPSCIHIMFIPNITEYVDVLLFVPSLRTESTNDNINRRDCRPRSGREQQTRVEFRRFSST